MRKWCWLVISSCLLAIASAGIAPPPAAAGAAIAHTVTNVNDVRFTISWVTESQVEGYVEYGTSSSLGSQASDDRGNGAYSTHHVTISGLRPDTAYYYDIISGTRDDNGGSHYRVTTGPNLALTSPSDIVGKVLLSNGQAAPGAIVYVTIATGAATSQRLSILVEASGWWGLDISTVRGADLKSYLSYRDTDTVQLTARGTLAQGTVSGTCTVAQAKNVAPTLTLNSSSSTPTPTPTPTTKPTPTPTPSPSPKPTITKTTFPPPPTSLPAPPASGAITQPLTVRSANGMGELRINPGTTALLNGKSVTSFTVTPLERGTLPTPPPGCNLVGQAFDFKPEGVVFTPPATLTLSYADVFSTLSGGDKGLAVAWLNPTDRQWVVLEGSQVNNATHTVTVLVSHFTNFCIMSVPPDYTGRSLPAATAVQATSPAPPYPDEEEPNVWVWVGGGAGLFILIMILFIVWRRSRY